MIFRRTFFETKKLCGAEAAYSMSELQRIKIRGACIGNYFFNRQLIGNFNIRCSADKRNIERYNLSTGFLSIVIIAHDFFLNLKRVRSSIESKSLTGPSEPGIFR